MGKVFDAARLSSIYVLVSLDVIFETECHCASSLASPAWPGSSSTPDKSRGTAKSTGSLANLDCPVGWVRGVPGCYFLSTDHTSWSMANSKCHSMGGHLFVPKNSEENDAITKIAKENNVCGIWIGLKRNEGGTFYTICGSKPTYTQWSDEEPNNSGGNENCAHIRNTRGDWNDNSCSRSFHFICEHRNCSCPNETLGVFCWPETKVGSRAIISCPEEPKATATRECQYKDETFQEVSWSPVNAKACSSKSRQFFDILQKPVNSTNVIEVGRQIRNLSYLGERLVANDIVNLAYILQKIVAVKGQSNQIADDVFNTVDNILNAPAEAVETSQQQKNSSVRIVQTLNNLLEHLNITETSTFQKTLKNFAVHLSIVHPNSFSGLAFSGTIKKNISLITHENVGQEISLSKSVPESNATTIRLPETLFNNTTTENTSQPQTVIFTMYKETKFFRVNSSGSANHAHRLNSYVIAGSIKALPVSNLINPVVLTYPNLRPGNKSGALCVFWNFAEASWSREGCTFQEVQTDGRIVCYCDHLTNFAILMDIHPGDNMPHKRALNLISYIGCVLSLVGLTLTIITMSLFKNLRTKIPNQILLNFCIALCITLVVFLVAAERSKTSSLASCRAAAIALHYFLLVVFMWMAVEAFNLYLGLVKVLPKRFPHFILKCSVVAWGLPAMIVSITISVALDDYGDKQFCRLHGVPFIVSFLVPVVLLLLGNSVAFMLIFYSLQRSGNKITSSRKITGLQRARQGVAIFVLLGLTWLFGVLAINDAKTVFQYLFCICNSLQGLLVFIFYCVLSSGTRRTFKSLLQKKEASECAKRNTGNSNTDVGFVRNTRTGKSRSMKKDQKENKESTFIVTTLPENPERSFQSTDPVCHLGEIIELQGNVTSKAGK